MVNRIVLLCLMLIANISYADAIEESSVRKFVALMDESVKNKDLRAINGMVADNFTFSLSSRLFGVSDNVQTDKEGFLDYMRDGLNVAEYYKSKREYLNVVIEEGRAICTSQLVESVVQKGMYISTITSEQFVIVSVNGSLQYTS